MSTLFDEQFSSLSPVWSRAATVQAVRGSLVYLWDQDDKRYLDFTCGIGVTNTGHCHPRVVKAIQTQAENLLHGQANIIIHEPMLQLVEELKTILPPSLNGFFFSNSGAEAVEGALKLARSATGRTNVIVFSGSFHGRTSATMALTTSKTAYRGHSQVQPPGVYVAPFPYPFKLGMGERQAGDFALQEVEELLVTVTSPEDTAAIIIEPVLGEGGYVPPPPDFLRGLRDLCDRKGILLIFDEVQSGFGRTGKWFAMDHWGVVPDILTVAKGIASGLPLSAVIASQDLMKTWPPGSHGGTYGGNALACAAAVATIQAMKEESMVDNARDRGLQLVAGLRKLQYQYGQIADIRGLGLMVGSEFTLEGDFRRAKPLVKDILHRCEEAGLLLLSAGTWDSTIRWIPPLNILDWQIEDGLGIFSDVLKVLL